MKHARAALVAASMLIMLALTTGQAGAHLRAGGTDWYFEGLTRGTGNKPSDPINFIIMPGPADTSLYGKDRIEEHFDDDWDTNAVGGRGWNTDDQIVIDKCKNDQKVVWVNHGSTPGTTSEKTDWHGSTSAVGACAGQHHARFWDDYDHRLSTTGHGDPYQWVIGGIHHEKVIAKVPKDKKLPTVKHVIDRDWDVVRTELTAAMHVHCHNSAWARHTGAILDEAKARTSTTRATSPGSPFTTETARPAPGTSQTLTEARGHELDPARSSDLAGVGAHR